jgi:hypothetical protein
MMGTGNDKDEVSGVAVLDQGEAYSSSREPSSLSHRDGDNKAEHGDADEEEDRINSSRLYGYEDPDRSVHSGNGRPNPERMIRRNVVTAEAARYEISYHPGRVVSIYMPSFRCELNLFL